MNGVLNIDKPARMTSHDVVARVRRLTRQKRCGHAGTLDPDATGVLLVCLGSATRLADLLADQGKSYDALLRLGITTSTEDASGEILQETDASHIQETDLRTLLPKFTGAIEQIPPMVSAVHHEGRRLYELAREGVTVERQPRQIVVEALSMSEFAPGVHPSARLRIDCGKGTYIRTLCADLGAALGVGGHMETLRRTSVGVFTVETAINLVELTPENASDSLVSPSMAVSFLPAHELTVSQETDVLHGRVILGSEALTSGSLVRLLKEKTLIALGRVVENGRIHPEKVFVTEESGSPPFLRRG